MGIELGDEGVGRLQPMFTPTMEELLMIPQGSEVLVIDDDTVACIPWNDDNIEQARVADAVQPGLPFSGTYVYLPPDRAPDAIIAEALDTVDLGGRTATAAGLWLAVNSRELGLSEFTRILEDIAKGH